MQDKQTLITTYLQMTTPDALRPAYVDDPAVRIDPMQPPDTEFYLFLYRSIGEKWLWRDRLLMPISELDALLHAPNRQIHVMYVGGVPAGYIELIAEDGAVEVDYFGLREPFIGRSLGKHLLSYGLSLAWAMQPTRVWLHTCNLDSPLAIKNYVARGFSIYDEKREPMPARYL